MNFAIYVNGTELAYVKSGQLFIYPIESLHRYSSFTPLNSAPKKIKLNKHHQSFFGHFRSFGVHHKIPESKEPVEIFSITQEGCAEIFQMGEITVRRCEYIPENDQLERHNLNLKRYPGLFAMSWFVISVLFKNLPHPFTFDYWEPVLEKPTLFATSTDIVAVVCSGVELYGHLNPMMESFWARDFMLDSEFEEAGDEEASEIYLPTVCRPSAVVPIITKSWDKRRMLFSRIRKTKKFISCDGRYLCLEDKTLNIFLRLFDLDHTFYPSSSNNGGFRLAELQARVKWVNDLQLRLVPFFHRNNWVFRGSCFQLYKENDEYGLREDGEIFSRLTKAVVDECSCLSYFCWDEFRELMEEPLDGVSDLICELGKFVCDDFFDAMPEVKANEVVWKNGVVPNFVEKVKDFADETNFTIDSMVEDIFQFARKNC
jgi:hypothetical protein